MRRCQNCGAPPRGRECEWCGQPLAVPSTNGSAAFYSGYELPGQELRGYSVTSMAVSDHLLRLKPWGQP